jgi:hypothetical protein
MAFILALAFAMPGPVEAGEHIAIEPAGDLEQLLAGAIERSRTPQSQAFSQRRPQSQVSADGASWRRCFGVSSNRRRTQVYTGSMSQRKRLMPTRRVPLRSI